MSSPGSALDAAALAALKRAAFAIVDLNLANAGLDDAELASIGVLPAVTHLRLARNRLTDLGVATVAALPALEHLNLYRNAGVTDEALGTVASSGSLQELFVWQTAVTVAGAARLRKLRPALAVDLGATPAP